MIVSVALLVIATFATPVVMACGDFAFSWVGIRDYVRKTFAPGSIRDFLMPPCAMCWGVRGAVAAALVLFVI